MKGYRNSGHSSWVYRGQEQPFTKFLLRDFLVSKLSRKPQIHYQADSYIPVETIQGHLLLIGSKQDEIWPANESIEKISERWAQRKDQMYHLEKLVLNHSGHMLTVAYQPNNRYKKIAWQEILSDSLRSWQATIGFFPKYL